MNQKFELSLSINPKYTITCMHRWIGAKDYILMGVER